MAKPKLKLGFTDYYPTMDEFFIDTLSYQFDIERDDASPDYLIFADETYGEKNKEYDPTKVVKIFFTGENRRPWNYVAHHAISFDHMDGNQFYRLPLYVLDDWVNTYKHGIRSMFSERPYIPFQDKPDFCGFVASNGICRERNNAFQMLNAYKPTKSGGPLFNNIGYLLPRDQPQSKLEFFKTCRFALCYENSSYPGYCTEKILHGFISGTVPIYWGSATVALDFNPKAFISRHNYVSDEAMMTHINFLEKHPEEYNKMMKEPIFSDYNHYMSLDNFVDWFRLNVYRGEKE